MKEKSEEKKEKNKPVADISFEVGFKDNKTRFDLRMISVAEEEEISQKFTDIADDDGGKAEKEYRICLESLNNFSVNPDPQLLIKFQERTAANERIVRTAFREFREALVPETNFL